MFLFTSYVLSGHSWAPFPPLKLGLTTSPMFFKKILFCRLPTIQSLKLLTSGWRNPGGFRMQFIFLLLSLSLVCATIYNLSMFVCLNIVVDMYMTLASTSWGSFLPCLFASATPKPWHHHRAFSFLFGTGRKRSKRHCILYKNDRNKVYIKYMKK